MKYEAPDDNSLPPGPSGVRQTKVVGALEELLEGPLISHFVSQVQVNYALWSPCVDVIK